MARVADPKVWMKLDGNVQHDNDVLTTTVAHEAKDAVQYGAVGNLWTKTIFKWEDAN